MTENEDIEFHYWRANDLFMQDRYQASLSHLEAALDIDPNHLASLIAMGEVYLFADLGEIKMTPAAADELALETFQKVLTVDPDNPEGWQGTALALLYQDRDTEALEAAEHGLSALRKRVELKLAAPEVYMNVAESLFDHKVRALLALGRKQDARETLSQALRECPDSKYLSTLTAEFQPE